MNIHRDLDMDMQHGNRYAARTWTCSMDMGKEKGIYYLWTDE
jgi:hypothetical protein